MNPTILIGAAMSVILAGSVYAKDTPTFYTAERVAVARENVERYDWARALLERIKKGDGFRYYIGPEYGPADRYIEQSDDFMWLLQPTTKIGRVLPPEAIAVCPVHGTKVREKNAWCPWNIDPINHPYKIQCQLGGEWYPSNDYAAGDMTGGEFPDDGEGIRKDGQTFYMLREYAHMVYGSAVIPALRSLSQAYQITGDARYGRKGAILLARLASEYPNHDDRQDRLHFAQYGGRSPKYAWKTGGMITDLIWETFCLEAAVLAYDGLFDYLDKDPDLLAFLKSKGMPIETGDDLRRYIEHYLVRAGMTGLLNGAIKGNEGHHQASALTCALVLDDFDGPSPNSADMVEYAFHGAGHAAFLMINGLTRDGGGHESPGYNKIKLDFVRVNDLMEQVRVRQSQRFPRDRYPDLFASDNARALFSSFIDMTMQDYFLPSIGDSGGIRAAVRIEPQNYSYLKAENVWAFARYGDPRIARAATKPDGTLSSGLLFHPYPADAIAAALQTPESQIKRESTLIDGYGVGILASGELPHRRTAMLNYTSLIGHRQFDNLHLELYARGVDMLPDLGYPVTWDYRWQWDSNSMAHNTVTVDETQPGSGIGGQARLFATLSGGGSGVHVISASHDPYPARDTDLYERTTTLIDVDAERFYVVDLFAVNGGEQHDQSWHALLEPVEHPSSLEWHEQPGTLAGAEVPQFGKWKDKWGRDREDFPAYLTHIRRATLSQPAMWTWKTGLAEGDALNMHLIPVDGPMELIAGKGRSPARPANWWLDYLIARRSVSGGGASLFLTVLDAYQGAPVVESVRLVSREPLVLEVTRADGSDLITLNIPVSPSRGTAHRGLSLRVQSRQGDQLTREVSIGESYHSGTIQAVDYDNHHIAVDPALEPACRTGSAIRIFNAGRSALYRIVAAHREDDRLWVTLDTGALIGRGQVRSVADGKVVLDAYLTFANGAIDRQTGTLRPGLNYYAGAYLEQGDSARRIKGAVRGETSTLLLEDAVSVPDLNADYADRVVSIWQYGVGDDVEVAVIE